MATTAKSGWRCAIIRLTPGNSSGPASITWANRAAGRSSPPAPACLTAPVRRGPAPSSGRVGGATSRWSTSPGAWQPNAPRLPIPASTARPPQQEFSDWTPRDSDPHDENVEVYSNCEEVELLLNGKSLGSQPLPPDAVPRAWKVAFEPGTLKALGRNKGQVVATHELRTAGKPARILLTADRATLTPDWDDVSYITAAVVDASGVVVPDAKDLVSFKLSGPGRIAAVDSGDNASHESFQADTRRAYQGQCIAILQATAPTGQIRLTGFAPGLASAALLLEVVSSPR